MTKSRTNKPAYKIVIINGKPISILICPYCSNETFEYINLGIPEAGTSVCLKCRKPIAPWARE